MSIRTHVNFISLSFFRWEYPPGSKFAVSSPKSPSPSKKVLTPKSSSNIRKNEALHRTFSPKKAQQQTPASAKKAAAGRTSNSLFKQWWEGLGLLTKRPGLKSRPNLQLVWDSGSFIEPGIVVPGKVSQKPLLCFTNALLLF